MYDFELREYARRPGYLPYHENELTRWSYGSPSVNELRAAMDQWRISMFKIHVCTSRRALAEQLIKRRTISFCVADNYTIYLHDFHGHTAIQYYIGLMWEDLLNEGNAGYILDSDYIAVRMKGYFYNDQYGRNCIPRLSAENSNVAEIVIRDFLVQCVQDFNS